MALTAASTDAEVREEYDNNASYDKNADTTECQDFIVACRFLIRRLAHAVNSGGESVELELIRIKEELDAAKAWLLSHAAPADVGRAGFTRARCL